MTIKYGEITLIRNLEEETVYHFITRNLGYENAFRDNESIIIQFDDNSIYDIKDKNKTITIKFGPRHHEYKTPIYFDISNNTLFYKNPTTINGIYTNIHKLDFKKIFSNCKKYNNSNCEPSVFNLIYDMSCHDGYNIVNKEIFAIVRLKSNETKPRFLLAYDDNYLNKDEILSLIDCIFKNKY